MAREKKSFKIKMPIIPMGEVSVVIDGMDLTNEIKALRLQAAVGEITELTLVFGAAVDIEGEAVLKLLNHMSEPLIEESTDED